MYKFQNNFIIGPLNFDSASLLKHGKFQGGHPVIDKKQKT